MYYSRNWTLMWFLREIYTKPISEVSFLLRLIFNVCDLIDMEKYGLGFAFDPKSSTPNKKMWTFSIQWISFLSRIQSITQSILIYFTCRTRSKIYDDSHVCKAFIFNTYDLKLDWVNVMRKRNKKIWRSRCPSY